VSHFLSASRHVFHPPFISTFNRAHIFRNLGYNTIILKDSDKSDTQREETRVAPERGIQILEWGNNLATEDALFLFCPEESIPDLLEIAIKRKNWDAIDAHILAFSEQKYGLADCLGNFDQSMRSTLGRAAKKKNWFKDIEPAEDLARKIIGPQHNNFPEQFTVVLKNIFSWMGLKD
jgi:hypothetical protein